MNWDEVKGNWTQFKGKVREAYGDLTDDELEQTKGEWQQVVGKIQEKYGKSKEEAERELNAMSGRW